MAGGGLDPQPWDDHLRAPPQRSRECLGRVAGPPSQTRFPAGCQHLGERLVQLDEPFAAALASGTPRCAR